MSANDPAHQRILRLGFYAALALVFSTLSASLLTEAKNELKS